MLLNYKYVMLQCNNILNDCWTLLKPFLYACMFFIRAFFIAKTSLPPGIFIVSILQYYENLSTVN